MSAKILLLLVAFVVGFQFAIYVPSIARYRTDWLQERIDAASLATVVLSPEVIEKLDARLESELLRRAEVVAITLRRPEAMVALGEIAAVDRVYDFREPTPRSLVPDALETLLHRGERLVRLIGVSRHEPGTVVDVILPEAPLWAAMIDYSTKAIATSTVETMVLAILLLLGLRMVIVVPLRRISGALLAFRTRPEDSGSDPQLPPRDDEIGFVQTELRHLREDVRRSLAEKTRLAALGASMTRISHDLRNMIATAVLISDRLEGSADPEVQQVTPRLIAALDRAVRLCEATLLYARDRPRLPAPHAFPLIELVDRVRYALSDRREPVVWRVEIEPTILLTADEDQLFRALLNLIQNAYEAMGPAGGRLDLIADLYETGLELKIRDNGPGIPLQIRARLFQPFAGTTKEGGNGLGLAIARELIHAQGGEVELRASSPAGTIFTIAMPRHAVQRSRAFWRPALSRTSAVGNLLAASALLAACSYQGPSLAGVPGLQFKTISFYERRALEESAACPQPQMSSVFVRQVVEDTPERLVLRLRYRYYDEGQRDFDDGFFGTFRGPFGCAGWGERVFTYAKRGDGGADPIAMSGPQTRRG